MQHRTTQKLNPQHFSVLRQFFTWCTTTTNTDGAFDPTFLGYPSLPWFKYEILCCKGFYVDVYVSLATVWRRPGRGQTAPISLSPRAFVVCPQVLPSLQSITTATATRFPSNQPFTFWLRATENLHSPFVTCPLNPSGL